MVVAVEHGIVAHYTIRSHRPGGAGFGRGGKLRTYSEYSVYCGGDSGPLSALKLSNARPYSEYSEFILSIPGGYPLPEEKPYSEYCVYSGSVLTALAGARAQANVYQNTHNTQNRFSLSLKERRNDPPPLTGGTVDINPHTTIATEPTDEQVCHSEYCVYSGSVAGFWPVVL